MPPPTLPNPTDIEPRRRTRTYDKATGITAYLGQLVEYVVSPFVTSVDTGDLKPTLASIAPEGWLILDGSQFDTAAHPDLFALLGGDTLPDFRGRFPVGVGGAVALLQTGGQASQSLTVANLPAHTHGVNDPGHAHGVIDPSHAHQAAVVAPASGTNGPDDGVALGATGPAATGITISNSQTGISIQQTGAGVPIDTTPPYIGINWMVKT